MNRFVRVGTLVLLFLTGLNALVAGGLFVLDPSGTKMGMTTDYLNTSPFDTFLIPGTVLFFVNGMLNILAAVSVIQNKAYAKQFVVLQGFLLVGWIVVQVWMVRDINPLHIVMFSIGILLIAGGLLLKKNPALKQ